jgi:rhodanese-related sulfurtransferase
MNNSFSGHGLLIDGFVYLSPTEALPFLEDEAILVDLREGEERNGRSFAVGNVILMPFRSLESEFPSLPKDRPLILADCVGLKSKKGIYLLRDRGYDSLASLIGGMVDWERDGMPTVIDRDEELAGGCACKLKPAGRPKPRAGC